MRRFRSFAIAVTELRTAARRLSWKAQPEHPQFMPHGEVVRALKFERGKFAASADITDGAPCVDDLLIVRDADRLEPPIAPAEQQALYGRVLR